MSRPWILRITDAVLDRFRVPSAAAPRTFTGSAGDAPPPMPAARPEHPWAPAVQRSGDPFDSAPVVGHYRDGSVFTFRGGGR
jgi:hypothetical protein